MPVPSGLSKTKIDKAGVVLREWWYERSSSQGWTDELDDAAETVWRYRSAFSYPLTRVNNNVRHYIRKVDCEVLVAQRLKRLPRIIEKLARYPNMRMTQMQDVGGCRAILPNQQAIAGILDGLKSNWDIVTVDDYVSQPKKTGYRAIHVIARRDDLAIELQLRTTGQQDWAEEVERIDSKTTYALKDGSGPPDVIAYTQRLAELIAAVEAGNPPSSVELKELAALRKKVP